MTVPTPKIIALTVTFFVAAVGAYFPWRYKHNPSPRSVAIMSYASMLAGGVFIAVGFLHLLGDAVEEMEEFTKAHGDYPFSLLFCSFGFLLTLCVDEIGHSLSTGHAHGGGKSNRSHDAIDGELTPLVSKEMSWARPVDLDGSPTVEIELETGPQGGGIRKRANSDDESDRSASYGTNGVTASGGDTHKIYTVESSMPPRGLVTELSPLDDVTDTAAHASHGSLLSSIVLATIFSCHSFFEGLALGIDNNTGSMIETAVGILAHKGLAGFALGVSILHGGSMPRNHYFAIMLVFCVMSPAGIVAGILLSSFTSPFWLACCFSVASGTFLFIGFMEIVMKELHPSDGRVISMREKLWKLFWMMAGFAAMAVVSAWGN